MRWVAIRAHAAGRRLAAAVILVLLGAASASGEPPAHVALPPGTTAFAGLPALRPHASDGSLDLDAWCRSAAEAGRRAAATRRGGDLLHAAAHVRHHHRRELRAAAALYDESLRAFPPGDVTRAVVLLDWLALESARGNAPQAGRLRARLAAWHERSAPRDAPADELRRWQVWRARGAEEWPLREAEHAEREGRPEEAARHLLELAGNRDLPLDDARRSHLEARAARLLYRAGDRAWAVRVADEAARSAPEERTRARLRVWSLYARHGLLDAQAAPRVGDRWPGPAFERDLRGCLRGMDGVTGVGTTYLALASRAFAAGRLETALAIYTVALRDPELVEQAHGDPALWRGLLVAYRVALELERFEQAERLLETVEHIADEPIPEKDAYLLAVRRARAAAAARDRAARRMPDAPGEPAAEPARGPTTRPAPRIATEPALPRSAGPPPRALLDDAGPGWRVATLLALAASLAVVWRVRRRRGES